MKAIITKMANGWTVSLYSTANGQEQITKLIAITYGHVEQMLNEHFFPQPQEEGAGQQAND